MSKVNDTPKETMTTVEPQQYTVYVDGQPVPVMACSVEEATQKVEAMKNNAVTGDKTVEAAKSEGGAK